MVVDWVGESGMFCVKNYNWRLFGVVWGALSSAKTVYFESLWEGFQQWIVEGIVDSFYTQSKEIPTLAANAHLRLVFYIRITQV
jgi:hypothetical protein